MTKCNCGSQANVTLQAWNAYPYCKTGNCIQQENLKFDMPALLTQFTNRKFSYISTEGM